MKSTKAKALQRRGAAELLDWIRSWVCLPCPEHTALQKAGTLLALAWGISYLHQLNHASPNPWCQLQLCREITCNPSSEVSENPSARCRDVQDLVQKTRHVAVKFLLWPKWWGCLESQGWLNILMSWLFVSQAMTFCRDCMFLIHQDASCLSTSCFLEGKPSSQGWKTLLMLLSFRVSHNTD